VCQTFENFLNFYLTHMLTTAQHCYRSQNQHTLDFQHFQHFLNSDLHYVEKIHHIIHASSFFHLFIYLFVTPSSVSHIMQCQRVGQHANNDLEMR
jgi:hypothetical protein